MAQDIPVVSLDSAKSIVDSLIAGTNCTPICGNPTCCIAASLNSPVYTSDVDWVTFISLAQNLGVNPYSLPDDFLLDQVKYQQLISDLRLQQKIEMSAFSSEGEALMSYSQGIGIAAKCSTCCYSCGAGTCCGGCWTFRDVNQEY